MKKYKVVKTKLKNGMHLLVHENHHLPEVNIQLWYNVGSKDEGQGQRGMAHLIEHMLFKGTKRLSESDINVITHKLAGYVNAFTSFDYTAYVYQVPSTSWQEPLAILADTMVNARFDEQMLNSEMLAVIQELKMYKDDYESELVEQMLSVLFPEHPYHHPIIGYKQDLTSLNRDTLFAFYQQFYHPNNATLVVVGDVKNTQVVEEARQLFEPIPEKKELVKQTFYFNRDMINKQVTLHRDVQTPWLCFVFVVPGVSSGTNYLYDMISMLFGVGRSSRFYELLVNEHAVATDVESFTFNLFEKSMIYLSLQPVDTGSIDEIEILVKSELIRLMEHAIEDWELERIKKRMRLGFADLLQSGDRQAVFIAYSFLAHGEHQFLDKYLELINGTTAADIKDALAEYFRPSLMHTGKLVPLHERDGDLSSTLQQESDKLDEQMLKTFVRTSEVEPERTAKGVQIGRPITFTYPRPTCIELKNGMQVMTYHTPDIPKISVLYTSSLDYFSDALYKPGINNFMFDMLFQGTKKHSVSELSKLFELQGIDADLAPGLVTLDILPQALPTSLELLTEVLRNNTFDAQAIERVRQKLVTDVRDYWDSPIDFVGQLARETVFGEHIFSQSPYGNLDGLQHITVEDLVGYQKKCMAPDNSLVAIVGDLSGYNEKKLTALLEKTLGKIKGPKSSLLKVENFVYKPKQINTYHMNRDQVVLGFVAPSIARGSSEYDILSLLDIVLTGGQLGSMSSRLFALREQSGLFYTIQGSLVFEARTHPGMLFIKTLVSTDKVDKAVNVIQEEIEKFGCQGITQDEFEMARNVFLRTEAKQFESTTGIAQMFLLMKRCSLGFDLFDKRIAQLSQLKLDKVNKLARGFCTKDILSVIKIGRLRNSMEG